MIERVNMVKMSILLKAIYRFNAIPIKIPRHCSQKQKKNPKICMESQKSLNSQSNPEKEEEGWSIILPDFKLYYKAIVIKRTWLIIVIQTNGTEWNRIKSPEINPCIYSQVICDKGAKNTQWGKDSFFNNWCWENWITTCRRMTVDPYLTPLKKIILKWIKD